MTPSLTHGAFRQMYGDNCFVAIGADVVETLKPLLPQSINYLVLKPDGCLCETGAKSGEDEGRLDPVGMALGLKCMVVGRETEQAALAWERHAEAQSLFDPLAIKVIGGFKRNKRLEAATFLVDQTMKHSSNLASQIAAKEESLAFLRRKNEWLLLNLEKSRRMIRGAGYSLRTITAELPAGRRTIGPGGDVNTTRFRQTLPCDAAGLLGLAIRVVGSISEPHAASLPAVSFKLVRESDNSLLVERTASFSDLAEGWFSLDLDDQAKMSFGDAALEVVWCEDAKENAPLFALADLSADRFGDSKGDTLALRVYSGLRPVPIEENVPVNMASALVETVSLSPPGLGACAELPFAHNTLEGGEKIVSFSDEWLQTHAMPDVVSGVKIPSLLPAGSISISASVCTDHELGPTCLFALVAVEQGAGGGEGAAGKLVEQLVTELHDGTAGEMATGGVDGVHLSYKVIPPNQSHHLELTFGAPLSKAADVFFVVRPVSSHAAYGWCRWSKLLYRLHSSADMVKLDDMPADLSDGAPLLMRTQKLSELAGRINFISGKEKLQELARDLGFSPLLFSEETGSLQTHPIKDHVSAGIFEGGVPTNALRVATAVETAHDSAPAFLYVIAVLDPAIKEKERAVKNLMQRIKTDDGSTWQGINGKKTVQWQAKMLYARQAALLELELAEITSEAKDVVFAVKPAVDSVSYGWCRWHSYNVTTVSGASARLSTVQAVAETDGSGEVN